LGTPHEGSPLASYGEWIANIAGNDTTLLQSLKPGADEVFNISRDFQGAYQDLEIICYYEKKQASYIGGIIKREVSDFPKNEVVY
jgi:hypothetical protein